MLNKRIVNYLALLAGIGMNTLCDFVNVPVEELPPKEALKQIAYHAGLVRHCQNWAKNMPGYGNENHQCYASPYGIEETVDVQRCLGVECSDELFKKIEDFETTLNMIPCATPEEVWRMSMF